MKFSVGILGILVLSSILATGCSVLFSIVYPLTPISSSLVTLFAIFGLAAACLIAVIFWKTIDKKTIDKKTIDKKTIDKKTIKKK